MTDPPSTARRVTAPLRGVLAALSTSDRQDTPDGVVYVWRTVADLAAEVDRTATTVADVLARLETDTYVEAQWSHVDGSVGRTRPVRQYRLTESGAVYAAGILTLFDRADAGGDDGQP